MAVMNVNPTRMQLTELKKKLITARRGHKLLKDKRDELMRQFLELVRENKKLRKTVEDAIKKANTHMSLACGDMSDESLDVALMMPSQKMSLELKQKNIMSVMVPEYDMKFKTADKGDIYSLLLCFHNTLCNVGQKVGCGDEVDVMGSLVTELKVYLGEPV